MKQTKYGSLGATRPRTKSLEQIGCALDRLRAQDIHNLFFVDDNLIGNPKLAKELLRYLAEYQRRHHYAFQFGTEVSVNLAYDAELLPLFQAANFAWVFIGIESPDENSLKETYKTQNTGRDLLSAVRALYATAWTCWRWRVVSGAGRGVICNSPAQPSIHPHARGEHLSPDCANAASRLLPKPNESAI